MPACADAGRPACPAGLGVLTAEIGPGLVDEVIERAGCREKRRRLLPAQAVVYFVLELAYSAGRKAPVRPATGR
jgi:Insertion element 4 transposase N-terminal